MTTRIPTLETERLIIRELTMEDLERVHQVLNESFGAEMALEDRERWLQWTVLGYEMFAALEQPHYGERGVALKETGELIGAIGTVPYVASFGDAAAFEDRPDGAATAEVGLFWVVAPAHQGQGYATEAAGAMVDYLFQNWKLGRIIATTGRKNLASQAVMRNLGMTVEEAEGSKPGSMIVLGVLDHSTA